LFGIYQCISLTKSAGCKYIEDNDPDEVLTLNEAREYYEKIKTKTKLGSKGN